TNLPGGWYAGLNKPPFNPPNWIFAPVWSIVYVLIALAGARTSERAPRSRAMGLWAAQMVLNFTWSPVFFTWHRTGLALIVIAAEAKTFSATGLVIADNDARMAPGAPGNPAFVADFTHHRLAIGANRLGAGIRPFETR
ncbi:TspO/MBR family protein, partial [Streptococcus suis]